MYDDCSYYHCGQYNCCLCGGYPYNKEDAPYGCIVFNKKTEKEKEEMKMNTIVGKYHVKGYGFKAVTELEKHSKEVGWEDSVVISSLSPAVMAEKGITRYYAPVLPRGAVYNTAEELLSADLDVNIVIVQEVADEDFKPDLIVSRHSGTIDLLREMYPDAELLSGNVTSEEISGGSVVGTLPPHLIQYCAGYRAAVIRDFDYSRDGDLSGEELKERLKLCDPIKVTIK